MKYEFNYTGLLNRLDLHRIRSLEIKNDKIIIQSNKEIEVDLKSKSIKVVISQKRIQLFINLNYTEQIERSIYKENTNSFEKLKAYFKQFESHDDPRNSLNKFSDHLESKSSTFEIIFDFIKGIIKQ